MMRFFTWFILFTSFSAIFTYKISAQEIIVKKTEGEIKGTGIPEVFVTPVTLPEVKAKFLFPKYLMNRLAKQKAAAQEVQVLDSLENDAILNSGEFSAFEIDIKNKSINSINPKAFLSQESVQALEQCPLWLRDQLKLKLILLNKTMKDAAYASLILKSSENIKDEVAFTIANMSYQSLTDSRFASDKDMIIRNAEFIYKVADSLQYVKLVEYGKYGDRDYYTTTKYRIFDPEKNDTIWSEIPKEYYYWYIVHPKLDQEGVYVNDNSNDSYGQRTYGYSWREFLWLNLDPQHNYMPVNITTNKGTVKDIPRFGELMQKAKYLWNRETTYYQFGRPLDETNSALDLLGNWASRALPVNVTLPRAFQPNQIIMKHNGMCNEDAFLVAAACRTALIPLIYLGSFAEDHVYGAIWDGDWYHYEFFRGGLEPTGNDAYGITNMMPGGSYGWKTSITEGFRPDGFPINFAKYYAKTSDYNVTLIDSIGNPIEGAMLQIYGPSLCGKAYTNREGKASFPAGELKNYLVQAYHPSFGWAPADSTKAYYLIQGQSTWGRSYNINIPYLNIKRTFNQPITLELPATSEYGIAVNFSAKEIISGINGHDGQRSRFYKWNDNDGMISFFICDSMNFDKFKKSQPYEAYEYSSLAKGGNISYGLPNDGKWYVVFNNTASSNIWEKVEAEVSILKGEIINEAPQIEENNVPVFPNPFTDYCQIQAGESADVEITDMRGVLVASLKHPFKWKPELHLESGVYFAKVTTGSQTLTYKLIYQK